MSYTISRSLGSTTIHPGEATLPSNPIIRFHAIKDGTTTSYEGTRPEFQSEGTWRSGHCRPAGTHKDYRSMTFDHVGGRVMVIPIGRGSNPERLVYQVHPASRITVLNAGPNNGRTVFKGREVDLNGRPSKGTAYTWTVVDAAQWINSEPTALWPDTEQPPGEVVMRPAQPRMSIVQRQEVAPPAA